MVAAVMGVDSSTQSCTVEIRELDGGALLATGRASHPKTTPPKSEQAPDTWWNALVQATAYAHHEAASRKIRPRILGISVAAQCHGLTIADAAGDIIRPTKLWNDTTSAEQAAQLLQRRSRQWWADEMGILPSPAITISKLMWLAENEPENFAAIDRIFVPHDWLTFKLTGQHVTDRSDASGTGYYSPSTDVWRTDLLQELFGDRDWEAKLPLVLGPQEPAGLVTPTAAAELGIAPETVVGPGGGDQHVSAQGIGLQYGDIAYSLGTSGVVFATSVDPIRDPSGDVDGVANIVGGYLPLVSTFNAAKVTDAFARLLGVSLPELGDLALAAPTSPDRPVLAAYLDGERTPNMPWARGMVAGLSSDLTREQFALAAVEGVVMGLVRGERRIASFGVPTDGRVLAIGGAAKLPAYRQVLADFTGRTVVTVDAPESVARGAAIQAAAIVNRTTVLHQTNRWLPPVLSRTQPKTNRNGLMDRYLKLANLQADGKTF